MPSEKLLYESFMTDRWMGSSAFLLPIEPRGLYREMLTQAWRRGGRLPNDHQAIQRAIGCTCDEWARCWPQVRRYWQEDGDWLVNTTQLELYAEAKGRVDRAHSKAMHAAASSPQVIRKRQAQGPPQAPPCEDPSEAEAVVEAVSVAEAETRRNGAATPTDHTAIMLDAQRRSYADQVWDEFQRRTGQVRLMSPAEFDVVKGWMDAGIPLRIVMRGIDDTKGQGRQLTYYGPSVKEAAARWRQSIQASR